MCVAAAIAGAAIIGAVATTVASDKSASATKDATNASINYQQSAAAKQTALQAPYTAIGTGSGSNSGAIQKYQDLLGLGSKGAAGEQAALQSTPGYQFTKNEGLAATKNAASASGMTLSGNTLQALDSYSSGLADSTYQNAVTNAQNAVTIGQNAASNTGTAIQNAANNSSTATTNQGNTLASIYTNEAAGLTKALSSGANQYATYNTLQGLNNPTSDASTAVTYNPNLTSTWNDLGVPAG